MLRSNGLQGHPGNSLLLGPLSIATVAIALVAGRLLAASIPDYRVTIDGAYHLSPGRADGEHGPVAWEHVNFGPRGHPSSDWLPWLMG